MVLPEAGSSRTMSDSNRGSTRQGGAACGGRMLLMVALDDSQQPVGPRARLRRIWPADLVAGLIVLAFVAWDTGAGLALPAAARELGPADRKADRVGSCIGLLLGLWPGDGLRGGGAGRRWVVFWRGHRARLRHGPWAGPAPPAGLRCCSAWPGLEAGHGRLRLGWLHRCRQAARRRSLYCRGKARQPDDHSRNHFAPRPGPPAGPLPLPGRGRVDRPGATPSPWLSVGQVVGLAARASLPGPAGRGRGVGHGGRVLEGDATEADRAHLPARRAALRGPERFRGRFSGPATAPHYLDDRPGTSAGAFAGRSGPPRLRRSAG